MITLQHVFKNYTTRVGEIPALDDINLHVKPGEIYGIIGKSGAGKSTLIRCINLIETPSAGKVIIDHQDLTTLSSAALRAARRHIGMIFQHFNLLTTRTVFDNVAFPLELAGCSKAEIAQTVLPLLELTGLQDKIHHYPAQLSGGQKQRVAIARALASKPKVLLSDEATSALDPETTLMILELLKNIRDSLNLTILLITHEMSVIKSCCDRVGILHHGKLIEENEIGAFFTHPKTAVAKNFIASSLPQSLPLAIEKHIVLHEAPNTSPVLRLWFLTDTATKPILSQLIKQFNLRINILQANVEYIKNHVMGIMLIAADGEKIHIESSIDYLKSIGVHIEVIGYVSNHVVPFN